MVLDPIDQPGPSPASCSFPLFCRLHPETKVSELKFVRAVAHQYVRFDCKTERLNVRIPNLVSRNTNGHYLAKARQVLSKELSLDLQCLQCTIASGMFPFLSY